jgi:hypothetical protein
MAAACVQTLNDLCRDNLDVENLDWQYLEQGCYRTGSGAGSRALLTFWADSGVFRQDGVVRQGLAARLCTGTREKA